jgi:hypothetical protein
VSGGRLISLQHFEKLESFLIVIALQNGICIVGLPVFIALGRGKLCLLLPLLVLSSKLTTNIFNLQWT